MFFYNFMFQIESKKPIVKKKITFLFSQKIGFMALHGKEYYKVIPLGLRNKDTYNHLPDVTKILIQKYYYADERNMQAA